MGNIKTRQDKTPLPCISSPHHALDIAPSMHIFILLFPQVSLPLFSDTSLYWLLLDNNPTQNSWFKAIVIIAHESVGQVGSSPGLGRLSQSQLGLFMDL